VSSKKSIVRSLVIWFCAAALVALLVYIWMSVIVPPDKEVVKVELPGSDQPLIVADSVWGYEGYGVVTKIEVMRENPHISVVQFVTSDADGKNTQILGGVVATGDVIISDRVRCADKDIYNHPNNLRSHIRLCVKEAYKPTAGPAIK